MYRRLGSGCVCKHCKYLPPNRFCGESGHSMYFPPFFAGNRKKNFPQLPIFSPQLFSPHMGGNTVSPPQNSPISRFWGGTVFCSPPKLGGNSEDLPPERPILRGKRQKSVPPNVGGGTAKKNGPKKRGEISKFSPHMRGKFSPAIRAPFPKSRILGGK